MPDPEQPRDVDSALDSLLKKPEIVFSDQYRKRNRRPLLFLLLGALCLGFTFMCVLWWKAPELFPVNSSISIEKGMTLGQAAILLAERHVIRSPFWFKTWSIYWGGEKGLKAGQYYLDVPLSVSEVAKRLTGGVQNLQSIKVTVPEGLSNREVATLLEKNVTTVKAQRFVQLGSKKEGYLFPDTYVFLPNATEEQILGEMQDNFTKKIEPLSEQIAAFEKPLPDIITMASLLEGEARTTETRRTISGILWKRLEIGMPLQVDAVFPYILGKNTYEVTTEDLKADSPYNTYLHAGLPPGPINNPGLDAILAAITPTESNYLYYLSDSDGEMHYAVTHSQHLVNRAKYLGK